jgi:hypothetical protein
MTASHNNLKRMIHRKPTVIQIKAEDDIQDMQTSGRLGSMMTPLQPVKNRAQNIRKMQMDGNSPLRSPYHSEMSNELVNGGRDDVVEEL